MPSPLLAETRNTGIPGRTARILATAASSSNSTAAAKSHFVTTAASALLKIVGIFERLIFAFGH